jgi:hypothetical protein
MMPEMHHGHPRLDFWRYCTHSSSTQASEAANLVALIEDALEKVKLRIMGWRGVGRRRPRRHEIDVKGFWDSHSSHLGNAVENDRKSDHGARSNPRFFAMVLDMRASMSESLDLFTVRRAHVDVFQPD